MTLVPPYLHFSRILGQIWSKPNFGSHPVWCWQFQFLRTWKRVETFEITYFSNHLNTEYLNTVFIWIPDNMGVRYSTEKVMWLSRPFEYQTIKRLYSVRFSDHHSNTGPFDNRTYIYLSNTVGARIPTIRKQNPFENRMFQSSVFEWFGIRMDHSKTEPSKWPL